MYFLIYLLILTPNLLFLFGKGKLLQINLANFFLLSHLLLFVVTPVLFQQFYILDNEIFQRISYISLFAMMCAFLVNVSILKGLYFEPRIEVIRYVFYLMMILSVFSIYKGLANVSVDRTMVALEGEYEGRGVASFLIFFAKILTSFYFGYLFHNKIKYFSIFYLLYFVSMVLTSAHRTPVLIAFLAPIILYFVYYRNGKVKVIYLVFGAILIANLMYFMNYYRQGIIDKMSYNGGVAMSASFLNTLSGINTTKNLYTLIERDFEVEYMGKAHYYLVGFIPRKLYPEKPVVSFNVRITESLFGYKIGSFKGADVITYTVPGEGYIQLSYLGVYFFTFISILMSRVLLGLYLRFKYSDFLIVSFLFSIFINFRSAFDSFYYSVVYSFVFLLLLVPFFRIKRGCLSSSLNILNEHYSLVFRGR